VVIKVGHNDSSNNTGEPNSSMDPSQVTDIKEIRKAKDRARAVS
jgi:hypothetical protein